MNMMKLMLTGSLLALSLNTFVGNAQAADAARMAELQQRLALARSQLQRQEDIRDIEILQRTYGYYVDKNLWPQIADLFTDDGTLEIGGRGVFVGKARVLEYLNWLGQPVDGRLYDHTQMQPVVDVSADGMTARGRWRALIFTGGYQQASVFGNCIYENEYRKENGVWKISRLHAYFIMYSDLAQGWDKVATRNTRPEQYLPPDLPPTLVYDTYPGERTAPYHYDNPVTAPAAESVGVETDVPADVQGMKGMVDALATRAARLGDVQAIERLQNIYGHYFDRWQWDQVAALFADDGSIELAQRGVYQGKQRVRESLNMFGAQGLHQGEIFNHLLYQPVIHVAADGQSANARFREFTMEGRYGGDGVIGGGVYENEYVKDDGVWKIKTHHMYTTFLADYHKGWSEGPLPSPGPSTEIPPDAAPTVVYESFPHYYVQPFHYDNPVTGRPPLAQ
ncbi:MAG: nuclear transport factor 2 family protein [Gammaproteobacteria bacterium]|nr:nuclear transport factor 2 family protein [Gammaproteobacteria bacterium]